MYLLVNLANPNVSTEITFTFLAYIFYFYFWKSSIAEARIPVHSFLDSFYGCYLKDEQYHTFFTLQAKVAQNRFQNNVNSTNPDADFLILISATFI